MVLGKHSVIVLLPSSIFVLSFIVGIYLQLDFVLFETGFLYVAQAVLELQIRIASLICLLSAEINIWVYI